MASLPLELVLGLVPGGAEVLPLLMATDGVWTGMGIVCDGGGASGRWQV